MAVSDCDIPPLDSYFAAPDGSGEPTLWYVAYPGAVPRAILCRCDLTGPDRDHHWEVLVAAMESA